MTTVPPHTAPAPASRVLIIRPSALGDVCRSVPVLASLRSAYPKARIDWLVQDAFAEAVAAHPMLDAVVPFARTGIAEAIRSFRFGPLRDFLRSLRAGDYDLVIDVQGLGRSGFFAWATRARRRVGDRHARELGWLGYTERHEIDPPPQRWHAVDRMLRLLQAAGVPPVRDMRLYTAPADRDWLLADMRLRPGQFAVVAPTSRWPGKRWPIDRFARVVEHLIQRGMCVAVVGTRAERDQCGPVLELAERDTRVVDLVGRTSLGRLMALIEASALVIANDSAALHMAVGFDRPYVALYGPTRVDLVGPYTGPREPPTTWSDATRGIVLQNLREGETPDHKNAASGARIMQRIEIGAVIQALQTLTESPRAT
jgi:heptosyltransferase I